MAGMDDFVLCYADDVLDFTKSSKVEDHIADLEKVFQQLDKNGIKIKVSKLKLGLKIMPFLGVVITRNGMIPDKEKTAAIDKLDYPTNLKELRSIQGMFAYYRRFIAKFSEIAAALYEHTKKGIRNSRNAKGIVISSESKASFDFLKRLSQKNRSCYTILTGMCHSKSTPTHQAKPSQLYSVKISKVRRECSYRHSKTRLENEQKYLIYEKEAHAVVWAAEVFRKFIRKRKTMVKTDCAALQWLEICQTRMPEL